jgi:DNA-binding response OmpR family regulator
MAQILVIDDDVDIAALIGLKLELDGHAVTKETDGPLDSGSIAAAGADEVVSKPFSPRHLSERVTWALNR